jgi:hypothetical protein
VSLKDTVGKPRTLTLLGSIVSISAITAGVTLFSNGSSGATGVITTVLAPTLTTLLVLYQGSVNGDKVDDVAEKTNVAAEKADAAATKADTIHGLVNGGLESRIANVVANVLPDVLRDVLQGTATTPPLLKPDAIAQAPTAKDATNG